MSTLHLARPDDLEKLSTLVAANHAAQGIDMDEDSRRAALAPLLDGLPQGAAYLIGPRVAPVGYILLSFGWSVAAGGMTATLDEVYIRERVRGRGMGTEALLALLPGLEANGIRAILVTLPPEAPRARRLFTRTGFGAREDCLTMIRTA
ncbi:MAG: GNAT family N-acetyltransferase [Paracoccaceae bacterium]